MDLTANINLIYLDNNELAATNIYHTWKSYFSSKLLPPREIDHSAMLEKELVNAGIIFSKKESIYTISIS